MSYLLLFKLSLCILFKLIASQQLNEDNPSPVRSTPLKQYVDVSNLHNEHVSSVNLDLFNNFKNYNIDLKKYLLNFFELSSASISNVYA